MDAVVEHTLYDWFRDIWLPAAGAILIPVAIAFFTWWFGASRFEKQKEIQNISPFSYSIVVFEISPICELL